MAVDAISYLVAEKTVRKHFLQLTPQTGTCNLPSPSVERAMLGAVVFTEAQS